MRSSKLLIVLLTVSAAYTATLHADDKEESVRTRIGGSVVFVQTVIGSCGKQLADIEHFRDTMSASLPQWTKANWPEINALRIFHAAFAKFLVARAGKEITRKWIASALAQYRREGTARAQFLVDATRKNPQQACDAFFKDLRAGKYPINDGGPLKNDIEGFVEKYQGRRPDNDQRLYFDIFPLLIRQ